MQELRDYQEEGVNALITQWENTPALLTVVATGGGKTTMMAETINRVINPNEQRALVIAHTEEIIYQLYERINNQLGDPGYLDNMSPVVGIVMAERNETNASIVVGTRQSLHKKRLQEVLQYGSFDYLFVDEGHHAIADNTYGTIKKQLISANSNLKIAGYTATPQRSDKKALYTFFDAIAFEWGIEKGIDSGYLVPAIHQTIKTEIDISGVASNKGSSTGLNQKQLVSVLKASNWLQLSVDAYLQYIIPTGRQALSYLPSVDMSRQFVEELKQRGIDIYHLDANTPKSERRELLRALRREEIHGVSNYGILTEGFDAPNVSAIFMARPTRSVSLFLQIIGRGLRRYPGKADCRIYDVTAIDKKGLNASATLGGNNHVCHNCITTYWKGFEVCPNCGKAPLQLPGPGGGDGTDEMRFDPQIIGGQFVSQTDNLFQNAYAAWFKREGIFSSNIPTYGTFVISPQSDEYHLYFVPYKRKQADLIMANKDIDNLIQYANKVAQENRDISADGNARWRAYGVSEKQKALLESFNLPIPDTRGQASDLISSHFAIQAMKQSEK